MRPENKWDSSDSDPIDRRSYRGVLAIAATGEKQAGGQIAVGVAHADQPAGDIVIIILGRVDVDPINGVREN
jgi:hypothetical protein